MIEAFCTPNNVFMWAPPQVLCRLGLLWQGPWATHTCPTLGFDQRGVGPTFRKQLRDRQEILGGGLSFRKILLDSHKGSLYDCPPIVNFLSPVCKQFSFLGMSFWINSRFPGFLQRSAKSHFRVQTGRFVGGGGELPDCCARKAGVRSREGAGSPRCPVASA